MTTCDRCNQETSSNVDDVAINLIKGLYNGGFYDMSECDIDLCRMCLNDFRKEIGAFLKSRVGRIKT